MCVTCTLMIVELCRCSRGAWNPPGVPHVCNVHLMRLVNYAVVVGAHEIRPVCRILPHIHVSVLAHSSYRRGLCLSAPLKAHSCNTHVNCCLMCRCIVGTDCNLSENMAHVSNPHLYNCRMCCAIPLLGGVACEAWRGGFIGLVCRIRVTITLTIGKSAHKNNLPEFLNLPH
jgi:hypothetical protein